jgi:hypothetical protein
MMPCGSAESAASFSSFDGGRFNAELLERNLHGPAVEAYNRDADMIDSPACLPATDSRPSRVLPIWEPHTLRFVSLSAAARCRKNVR